jgi:hypothetical protein
MGTLDISGYVDSSHGNLIEPPIEHQSIELSDEPASCKPLNKFTRILRIVSDCDCLVSVAIGASRPTQLLRAGVPEIRVVQPDSNFLVTAVATGPSRAAGGSHGLWSFGDLSNSLALVANPGVCKQRLDAIAAAMGEAQERIAEAHRKVGELKVAEKAHQEMLARTSAENSAAIAAERQTFDEECAAG